MQKISTCIVYNNQAEEAVNFYCSIFKVAKITSKTYCGEGEFGGPPGSVRSIVFQLHGQNYLALNGGPHFAFNDGVSLMVYCDTQEEIDNFWERLSEGGEKMECGWLKDKFGMRWQIVPRVITEMMSDPDSKKFDHVMQAVLKMKKLDLAALKEAYE